MWQYCLTQCSAIHTYTVQIIYSHLALGVDERIFNTNGIVAIIIIPDYIAGKVEVGKLYIDFTKCGDIIVDVHAACNNI